MKSYKDDINNVSVPSTASIMAGVKSKMTVSRSKPITSWYIGAAACVAILLLSVWAIPMWFQTSDDSRYVDVSLNTLFFNAVESSTTEAIGDRHVGVMHSLTDEQVKAVLHMLELPPIYSARAYYCHTGELIEMSVSWDSYPEYNRWLIIRLGVDSPLYDAVLYSNAPVPVMSDVHGIAVAATITDSWWIDEDLMDFSANFRMNDISYRIAFTDENELGQMRMTELVNNLILAGSLDMSVLDIVVPGFQADWISYEAAQQDPEFGEFLPVNIPERFFFFMARRDKNVQENHLTVDWRAELDWMVSEDEFSWRISMPSEAEGRVVSAEEELTPLPEYWRHISSAGGPVFLAEDLTIDNIRELAVVIDHGEEHTSLWIGLGVLLDDVVIDIRAVNLSPEDIWMMIADLL